uniref:Phosphatidate cytidylyltransferase, mitochondrial n=1 Tax=Glossina brevipalpis TaxID=37001 RepID=A0A1A9W6H7_9MUSC
MNLYRDILARFPRGNLSYVFAYGSAVKQQLGYKKVNQQKDNIIDLIFCVKDPVGWHAENIKRHESHYSALRHLGPIFVMKYQEYFAAKVYFNTLVPFRDLDVNIKYGVISREHLLQDLSEWKYLYIAGRLHKPVVDIVPTEGDQLLTESLANNLRTAFQISLLLLPEKFTPFELFCAISNLSYKGDFRMIFGENKNKVQNIVKAQIPDFLKLYEPAMKSLSQYVAMKFKTTNQNDGPFIEYFEQDKSSNVNEHHLRHAPVELRKRLLKNAAFKGTYPEVIIHLAKLKNLHDIVQVSVNDIVWRSSITQSLKNIPSAGLVKSLAYSYRKALKTFST